MLLCKPRFTPSLGEKPLPSLVPTTVSIAASEAMSRILSLTGPLNTIATAPSASSAASANFDGLTASETVPSTFTNTALFFFSSAMWSKYSCTSAGASSGSSISSSHASASSLGSSSGNFAANLDASIFVIGTLLRSSEE